MNDNGFQTRLQRYYNLVSYPLRLGKPSHHVQKVAFIIIIIIIIIIIFIFIIILLIESFSYQR